MPRGQGKQVFVTSNFTQENQHVALPHQMRALLSGMWESTLEILSQGIKALLDHDGESQHDPVIVSANYRRPVERIAE